jgi:deoxyguanosine kinase
MSLVSTSENSTQKELNSLIFSIEGNIGVGKSTLLKILSENMIEDIEYLPENVSSWQNLGGQNINLLEMMYKDPVRYGFIF